MRPGETRSRNAVARALFALAALILVLGPPLDAVAHTARVAVERGEASTLVKLISAFDVINDSLDWQPGTVSPEQQHLVVAPWSFDEPIRLTAATRAVQTWPRLAPSPLISQSPDRLERPPRS